MQDIQWGKGQLKRRSEMNMAAAIALEVMDKEWPLWFVLLSFAGVAVVGLLVCRKWPLAALLIWAWAVFGGLRLWSELNDQYVGPAIRSEAGVGYAVLSYASVGAAVLLPAIGVWQNRARRTKRTQFTSSRTKGEP